MGKQIGLIQAEEILAKRFKNQIVSFSYPGFQTVYGKVDEISIDTTGRDPYVVIQLNNYRYTCSPGDLKDCLKLHKNGNSY